MEPSVAIGERLRKVREDLGMNQTEFAALAGATRQTQSNYEKGERMPDALYLAVIAAAGADVSYILTGIRAGAMVQTQTLGEPLTPREAALLDNYRHSPEALRDAMDKTGAAFAQSTRRQRTGSE